MPVEYIDRPPRIQPELPIGQVDIPAPPEGQRAAAQNIASALVPMITIVGFMLVSSGGNLGLMLPMGLVMGLSVVLSMGGGRKEKRELEAKKKAYAEKLAEMRQEMTRAHNAQRLFYRHNYPDMQTVFEIAERSENSRFGPRRRAGARAGARAGGGGSGPRAGAPRHSVGVFGKNPTNTADLARAMLAHFVAFHSAVDTPLDVIGPPHAPAGRQG